MKRKDGEQRGTNQDEIWDYKKGHGVSKAAKKVLTQPNIQATCNQCMSNLADTMQYKKPHNPHPRLTMLYILGVQVKIN